MSKLNFFKKFRLEESIEHPKTSLRFWAGIDSDLEAKVMGKKHDFAKNAVFRVAFLNAWEMARSSTIEGSCLYRLQNEPKSFERTTLLPELGRKYKVFFWSFFFFFKWLLSNLKFRIFFFLFGDPIELKKLGKVVWNAKGWEIVIFDEILNLYKIF